MEPFEPLFIMKTYVIVYNNDVFFTDDEFDQGIKAMEWAEHFIYTVAPTMFTLDGKDHKWTYVITSFKPNNWEDPEFTGPEFTRDYNLDK